MFKTTVNADAEGCGLFDDRMERFASGKYDFPQTGLRVDVFRPKPNCYTRAGHSGAFKMFRNCLDFRSGYHHASA